jgi:hypothetical protein
MKTFFAVIGVATLALVLSLTPALADATSGQIRDGVALAEHAVAVTPNDSTDLAHISRYIVATAGGNISVITVGGETVTIPIAAGEILPIKVTRIRSTNTTATGIVYLY